MKTDITYYKFTNPLLKPKKIIFVSDIHSGVFLDINKIIKDTNIDYLFIAGDIINGNPQKDNWMETFKWLHNISKKIPVYISLGNHEIESESIKKFKKYCKNYNVNLLDNEFVMLDDFYLYGYTPPCDKLNKYNKSLNIIPQTPDKEKTIILSHRPKDFYINGIKDGNFFLTLSGHNHGGQWRFFGRGVYSPDEGLFPKYTSGTYFNKKLLITRGLGNQTNIPRIFNKPEIVVIKIN